MYFWNSGDTLSPFSCPHFSFSVSTSVSFLGYLSLPHLSISQKLLSFIFFNGLSENEYPQDFFQCIKLLLVQIVITAQNFPTRGPLRGSLQLISLLAARHAHIPGKKAKMALTVRLMWGALVSPLVFP